MQLRRDRLSQSDLQKQKSNLLILLLGSVQLPGERHDTRMRCRLLQDDQKDSGLLPVLARLVKGFSHRHQPRSHAGDLVESIHVVLRLLDRLCQPGLLPRSALCNVTMIADIWLHASKENPQAAVKCHLWLPRA